MDPKGVEAADAELVVADPDELAERLAHRLRREAGRAIADRGRFVLALPGGSVAERFLPRLARAGLDPHRIDLVWADERAVAPDDPESNYALARRLWLDPVRLDPERVHRMPADLPDLDEAARLYERELDRLLGAPRRLDAALLGVGADGHVASLFLGSAALAARGRTVLAVDDSPKPPARRLTLSLPMLAAASLLVVAAFGAAKASAIAAALRDPSSPLPVARLARASRRRLFLVDAGAAAWLDRPAAPPG